MYKELLQRFIIGSSLPSVILCLMIVNYSLKSKKGSKYTYYTYSIVCPLFFGIMNIISYYIGKKYNMSLKQRILFISMITPLLVISYVFITNTYNLQHMVDYIKYMFISFMLHFIVWNLFIYNIEKALT